MAILLFIIIASIILGALANLAKLFAEIRKEKFEKEKNDAIKEAEFLKAQAALFKAKADYAEAQVKRYDPILNAILRGKISQMNPEEVDSLIQNVIDSSCRDAAEALTTPIEKMSFEEIEQLAKQRK